MTVPKPTIVLVPGAWHGPAAFDPILPLLHAAGYITTSISLPSVGASPGREDFTPDVDAIRTTVGGLAALGREVVLVSHSYGAVVATEAVRGLSRIEREQQNLPGGVVHLAYVSSILPKIGQNTMDSLKGGQVIPIEQYEFHGDGTSSIKNSEETFYNDLSPELAKYYTSILRPQSLGAFHSPLTYDAYRHIPSSYLVCTQDNSLSQETQRRMARDAGIQTIKTVDSSHSPFLSQPEAVVLFIREMVE